MNGSILFVYDDLIAAAAQSQSRPALALSASSLKLACSLFDDLLGKCGYAHTYRNGNTVHRMDRAYFIQKGKILALKLSKAARFRQEK